MMLPEIRVVPPPADGLASAFRQAAARRRRKAATTGGAGVLGAAVVLATLTGGTGHVLTQEDPVPPADQRELVLPPEGPVPGPTLAPAQPTTTEDGDARTVTSGPGGPVPSASSSPAPAVAAPRAAAPERPVGSPYRVGPMSRDSSTAIPALSSCTTVVGLCSAVYAGGPSDAPYLQVELCNSNADAVRVDFAALDEVDIAVTRADEVVWRWAAGRPRVSDPHQVRLNASSCLVWTTPWAKVDQSGRPLPRGSYVARSTIDSPDAAGVATAEHSFTVDGS